MNSKVTLTLLVPGAKMLSEKVCERDKLHNYKLNRIKVTSQGKADVIQFYTRKNAKAKQVIHISDTAYLSMISVKECPYWAKQIDWKNMPREQRLKKHLERIAEDLHGEIESYEVLPD